MDLLGIISYAIIKTNTNIEGHLKRVAQVRIERERLEADRVRLDNRVQAEAKRLQVGSDKFDVIRDIIVTFGDDSNIALAVAKAESGLRCEAYHFNNNGTIDHSIFQLNSVHKKRGNLENCKENIKIAYEIFKEQGWTPWVVYNTKSYLKYL